MQHAADAAVVAGAAKLLTNKEDTVFSDYTAAQLISKVPHYLTSASITSEIYTGDGDEVAKTYVKKNMATDNSDWNDNTIADSWTKKDLTFGRTLWGSDERDFKTLYYQVVLRQEVGHLFLGGFTPMTAVVSSVAKITRYEMGDTLFNQMSKIRDERTYPSWSKIRDVNQEKLFNANPEKYGNNNKYEGQLKKDSDNAADNRSVLTTGVWYKTGDHYREETLTLNNKGGNGNKIDQTAYDDLFLDWRAEVDNPKKVEGFTVDWDMNYTDPNIRVHKSWDKGDDKENAASPKHNMRIYGLINIDNTYPVRDAAYYKSHANALNDMKTLHPEYVTFSNNDELAQKVAKEPPDPLFARIESEPIRADWTSSWHTSSVRQIIINVNTANTNTYDASDAYPGQYRDRPIVFFYEGPEKVNAADVDEHGRHVRDSLPVILNLNQDFRGVLFAPNSPVVVVGHNKNFQGFVVAKSFVELDTSGYVQQPDGSYMKGGKTYYKKTDYGFDMFIDERGNVQYKKDANGNYTTVKPVNTAKNFTYYYETVDPAEEDLPDYYVEGETEYITKKIDADGTFKTLDPPQPMSKAYELGIDPTLRLEEDEVFGEKFAYLNNKKFYDASQFDLKTSTYDSFYMVRFGRYIHVNDSGSFDNMFTTDLVLGDDLSALMSKLKDGTLSDDELNALLNALRAQGLTDDDLEAVSNGEVTDEEYAALQTKLYLKDLIESSTYVR